MVSVLFVCLGNICRSPTAHGVFEQLIQQHDLHNKVRVDSCGTGAWHIGQAPDDRTQKAAKQKGYDLSHLRARRLQKNDFDNFDYILAMDTRNLADIMKMAPDNYQGRIQLFMDYSANSSVIEVPDPYYGGEDGFESVLMLVEEASANLLLQIKQSL